MDPRQAAMIQALLARVHSPQAQAQAQGVMGSGGPGRMPLQNSGAYIPDTALNPQQIQQMMQNPYGPGTSNPSMLQSIPPNQLMMPAQNYMGQ